MRKKLLGLIIAIMLLSFCGCDGGKKPEDETSQTTQTAETTPVETVITTITTETTVLPETTPPPKISEMGESIVQTAKSLYGIGFSPNGQSPETGFDNSGFIYYVLRENGFITWPRGIVEQAATGSKISLDQLKPGDAVFFKNEGEETAGFGGIYIGNMKMVACLTHGEEVKEVDIDNNYYKNHFYTGISLS